MDFRRGKILVGKRRSPSGLEGGPGGDRQDRRGLGRAGRNRQAPEDDAASLKEINGQLANQQSQIASCYQRRRLISGGLGLGLIGMIAIGGVFFQAAGPPPTREDA